MATENEQAGDHPDDVESVEEEEICKMLKFPNIMSTLQTQRIEEMLAALPMSVKRRLKALKRIQLDYTNLEVEFFKEVHALECKYHKLYEPLYEKREKIVTGKYEPTEPECEWQSDDEDIANDLKEKATIENKNEGADIKGIPEFWLTILKNCRILAEMVQPHDEPILKHLIDIKSICEVDPMIFTLEFHFSPNEYFTNSVLEKKYFLKCVPEKDEPFEFEGPEICKCTGCVINWNKGKNVTVKTIKKKQKHKSRGVIRTVTKTVQNDSFFNFFSPPVVPETEKEEVDDEIHAILTTDFEIGHYIRERIIPRAVLYFTGEGIEDEEDFEEEEEEDDEEEDFDTDGGKELKDGEKDPKCKQQ
ncbi:nucleosome assembly protein 1-like 1-A [Coccinella septempunctata]|uniref:nucleosome assembly protein 1-like 1-A n=1 Tax=Coccinella septempunctata TaxID=41139 RepID=UPI001D07DB09|nr:nucleosome assembly protein 1-like 1-A [Coccinella septempunctata]